MPKLSRSILAALSLAGGVHAQGIPAAYTLVELQPLGGGTESVVSAINDRGEIVGRTEFNTGPVATSWDLSGAAGLVTFTGGGSATDAVSINNEGSMLVECGGCELGFGVRLSDGTLLELPNVPGGGTSSSIVVERGINDAGQAAGVLTEPGVKSNDFSSIVWELAPGPQMVIADTTLLVTRGLGRSVEDGLLADNGLFLAGEGSTAGGASFFVLDTRTGDMSVVDPGEQDDIAAPADLNNNGQFVGIGGGGGGDVAFLFDSRTGTRVPITGIGCNDFDQFCFEFFSSFTYPSAINENGIVVGAAEVFEEITTGTPKPTGESSGFVWSESTLTTDLRDLLTDGSGDGWSLVPPTALGIDILVGPADINESGIIVGNGVNPLGEPAAYVLIPRLPCAADVNRNGEVTPGDFNAWILAFNNSTNGGCD